MLLLACYDCVFESIWHGKIFSLSYIPEYSDTDVWKVEVQYIFVRFSILMWQVQNKLQLTAYKTRFLLSFFGLRVSF